VSLHDGDEVEVVGSRKQTRMMMEVVAHGRFALVVVEELFNCESPTTSIDIRDSYLAVRLRILCDVVVDGLEEDSVYLSWMKSHQHMLARLGLLILYS
jgi:hypothetical protein